MGTFKGRGGNSNCLIMAQIAIIAKDDCLGNQGVSLYTMTAKRNWTKKLKQYIRPRSTGNWYKGPLTTIIDRLMSLKRWNITAQIRNAGNGTVTYAMHEQFKTSALDTDICLGAVNISNYTVKSDNGVTTYTENTDYTMNATEGKLKPKTGGSMAADTTYRIDYTYSGGMIDLGDDVGRMMDKGGSCVLTFNGVNHTGFIEKYEWKFDSGLKNSILIIMSFVEGAER